jgi:hypothetical protein
MAGKIEGIEVQFDSLLKMVKSGRVDTETALAEFPQSERELRQLLEIVFWLEAKRGLLDPRPEFVADSRRRMVEKIGNSSQSTSGSSSARRPSRHSSNVSN